MLYTFGDCVFDTQLFTVQRAGQTRRLRPKVFQLLLYLVVHRDRVISKQELSEQVWSGRFISDATLESHIRLVRQAVGDSGRAQHLIQTLYGHGYRFIGVVEERSAAVPTEAALAMLSLPPPMTEPEDGEAPAAGVAAQHRIEREAQPAAYQAASAALGSDLGTPGNRQLTVLVCHLAEATALAMRLEPEALHAVLHAYHVACTAVIARFGGYVAQSLGERLVVYFGFPQAHEDDARRAAQAGLALIDAMAHGQSQAAATAVQVGIHTSPVVVGASAPEARLAVLAMGEAPQLAPQLALQAAPQTVAISAATARLVAGWFVCEALDAQPLPGLPQPVPVYRVLRESGAQSRFEAVGPARLTPLVGRTAEVALLQERWAQARDGSGQVVLLSGEAGIGKSRLAESLREQVAAEGYPQIVMRCSPYHMNSALYPVIEHVRRVAGWHHDDAPATKLDKLEQVLQGYGLALEQMVPLFAALLSVPLLERYPPVHLTPQRQKQQTQEALVAWLLAEAEQQPVLIVWEDLHWADPSTLELLSLWINQVPTMRVLTLLLCRPEFPLPWTARAHLSQLTLSRFTRPQVEQMLAYLTCGQPLPEEVREQVIARTDGVPLFLEECIKMLLESSLIPDDTGDNGLTNRLPPLIPTTLQDALMARLDRLGTARDLAQIGATWGRGFTYEQLQALVPLEDNTFAQRLGKLVDAEILYQRGLPPRASYRFKHALIQEAAYQSLLKRTRQQYHQRIAQVLETRMPETVETQPELLAHHYTEAGLPAQAIPYWQRAGEYARQRSANLEAIVHLTKGLEVLTALPDTPERVRQEIVLQTTLAQAISTAKGFAAPEVQHVYSRAHDLCQQVGDTSLLFPVLYGLGVWYMNRAQLQPARDLLEQHLHLAQHQQDPTFIVRAHVALGSILYHSGEFASAVAHIEQCLTLSALQGHRLETPLHRQQPIVTVPLSHAAWALWCMGHADQSLARSHKALRFAQKQGHPFMLTNAFYWAAQLHQFRRDSSRTHELAEATIALSTEQGFAQQIGQGLFLRGWALAMQGQAAAGLSQMREGFAVWEATGAEVLRPYYLALLAEVSAYAGQTDAGLELLAEALVAADKSGERSWEAEVYRMKGEFLLRQAGRAMLQPATPEVAEACFHQALATACRQEAKALELRAAMSLSRLWQRQGKWDDARGLLAPIYGWFTEGFDTVDLQEARALLDAL